MCKIYEKCNGFNKLILCALSLITVTPMLGARVPMIIIMILVLLWIIDALLNKHFPIPRTLILVLPYIITGIIFAYKILGFSSAEWGNYAVQLYFFTSIWMMLHIKYEFSVAEKKCLSYFCFYVILANVVSNIYMYYALPGYTAWSYVGASKITEYVRNFNLGSTSFVSTVTIFSGVTFSLFTCTKIKRKKIIFATATILNLFYIIVCSGRATAFIQVVLMFILFYLYRNEKISIFVPFLIVLFAIVFYVFGIQILDMITEFLPNERMAVRIKAIRQFLSGTDAEGDYLTRIEIINLDFSTWLRSFWSFCFGIGDHRYLAGNLSEIYTIGISGHSDFFDFLAEYGILGFSLLNLLFIKLLGYFHSIDLTNKRFAIYISIVFVMFVFRSLMGTIFSMNIATAMFLFSPTSMYLLDDEIQDRE